MPLECTIQQGEVGHGSVGSTAWAQPNLSVDSFTGEQAPVAVIVDFNNNSSNGNL